MKYLFFIFIILFLWFGIRPIAIRRYCIETKVKVEGRSFNGAQIAYPMCLVSWGMKPEKFLP